MNTFNTIFLILGHRSEKDRWEPAPRQSKIQRQGFTLVEMLVVVSIMVVLMAVTIPRLRVINKDRNLREAARMTGSVFASASQRAVADEGAGVLMERHPNFVDANGVHFATTTLYVMRNLPPYIGDVTNSTAFVGGTTASIPVPFDHTPATPVVQVNDTISLNNSSVEYRILNVQTMGPNLVLTLDLAGYLPAPASGAGIPFVIHRQPRKLVSSKVELPEGYLVDLRYSGPLKGTGGSVFNTPTPNPRPTNVRVLFDKHGAIARVYYQAYMDPDGNGPLPPDWYPASFTPPLRDGLFHLFVAHYELDDTIDPLQQPSNMWVTVNDTSGSVNVAYSVPPTGTVDVDGDGNIGTPTDKILEARQIAVQQKSAAQ